MYYSKIWQVGLDIQVGSVRGLAILRRRDGWQLCHCWQQQLPPGTLHDGNLHHPEVLSKILRQWHKQLPKHISLRIALPAQRILQQSIPVPDKRLKEPEKSWVINVNAAKQFPLDSQALALDYRSDPANSSELLVTAARQDELQRWQHCLQEAHLHPQVIDITPCALRYMANAAKLSSQHMLVHRLENEWLWVAPLGAPFQYGLIPLEPGVSTKNRLKQLPRRYFSANDSAQEVYYYSGVIDEPIPTCALEWSPFSIFKQLTLPLPALPTAFVVAGGLALRSADS